MSSTMDPAKLKVVDLRSELNARGLDTKGNKAVLVKRLKDALEKELQQEIPDTSIADTSTEDLNASQQSVSKETENDSQDEEKEKPTEEKEVELEDSEMQESQEKSEDEKSSQETESKQYAENGESSETAEGKKGESDINHKEKKEDKTEMKQSESQAAPRGEKRRRSPSPGNAQQKRARSPIKEDEPPIDNDKVQLSWYDCDLHLNIDKQSFLSAKPYHEGAFGYAWAGVRATHGVNSGKACYEVKITEALKWEEIIKPLTKKEIARRSQKGGSRRDDQKRDGRKEDRSRKGQSESNKRKESESNKQRGESGKKGEKASSTKKDSESDKKAENASNAKKNSESDKKGENASNAKKDSESDKKGESASNTKKDSESDKKGENASDTKKDSESDKKEENASNTKTESESDKKKENAANTKKDSELDIKEESEKEGSDESNKKVENGTQETEVEKMDTSESVVKEKQADSEVEKMEIDKPEVKQSDKSKEGKLSGENKEQQKEVEEVIEPLQTHLIRIGWSILDTGLQLGETKNSYAYESSGRFIVDGEFTDYGVKAEVGDVIGAYVDISQDSVSFTFTINGALQPVAKTVSRTEFPENFALFPHILSKNYVFEVNLGTREEPWFPNPQELESYQFVSQIDDKITGPVRPEKRDDCEVIMMCGLPASGKTYWARQWVEQNPQKRYTLVGNSHLLERMTINGKPLKTRYQGKWNTVLDKIIKCMNILLKTASLRRRNYILDQTNVLPTAQRDKMRLFEGFKRRAVIVIVNDEEQAKRQAQQEAQGGKDLPDSAVLEMKAMMGLPKTCDWLKEITYAELNEEESRKMVQKYNKEGRDAGFKAFPDRKDNRYPLNRWDHNSSRRFRGYNRHYSHERRGNWGNRRPPSGSWNQDVRNRGPSSSRDWGRQGSRAPPRDNRSSNYSRNQRGPSGSGSWQSGWQGQGNNWSSNQGQNWGGSGWSSQGQGQGQWKGSYNQGGNYNQSYGQSYGNYGSWDNYYGQGYNQGWSGSQGSQYSGSGYGDSYGQYPSNSWSQGQGGGKYNRK